jgi:hypothetical protein
VFDSQKEKEYNELINKNDFTDSKEEIEDDQKDKIKNLILSDEDLSMKVSEVKNIFLKAQDKFPDDKSVQRESGIFNSQIDFSQLKLWIDHGYVMFG